MRANFVINQWSIFWILIYVTRNDMRALSCVTHRNYSIFYDHVYIRGIFRPIARESATKFVILSIIHARSAQYQLINLQTWLPSTEREWWHFEIPVLIFQILRCKISFVLTCHFAAKIFLMTRNVDISQLNYDCVSSRIHRLFCIVCLCDSASAVRLDNLRFVDGHYAKIGI